MKNSNKNQGIAHLVSIFLLPVLVVAAFYVKWIVARLLFLGIFIYVATRLWKKVLKD